MSNRKKDKQLTFSAKWCIFKTYLCFFFKKKKSFFFFNLSKELHCYSFSISYSSKLVFYIDLHRLLCNKMSLVSNQQFYNFLKSFSIKGPLGDVFPSEIWNIVYHTSEGIWYCFIYTVTCMPPHCNLKRI